MYFHPNLYVMNLWWADKRYFVDFWFPIIIYLVFLLHSLAMPSACRQQQFKRIFLNKKERKKYSFEGVSHHRESRKATSSAHFVWPNVAEMKMIDDWKATKIVCPSFEHAVLFSVSATLRCGECVIHTGYARIVFTFNSCTVFRCRFFILLLFGFRCVFPFIYSFNHSFILWVLLFRFLFFFFCGCCFCLTHAVFGMDLINRAKRKSYAAQAKRYLNWNVLFGRMLGCFCTDDRLVTHLRKALCRIEMWKWWWCKRDVFDSIAQKSSICVATF